MTNKEILRRVIKELNKLINTRYVFSLHYGYADSPYTNSYISIYIHCNNKIVYSHIYDYTNKDVHIELQNLTELIDEFIGQKKTRNKTNSYIE